MRDVKVMIKAHIVLHDVEDNISLTDIEKKAKELFSNNKYFIDSTSAKFVKGDKI